MISAPAPVSSMLVTLKVRPGVRDGTADVAEHWGGALMQRLGAHAVAFSAVSLSLAGSGAVAATVSTLRLCVLPLGSSAVTVAGSGVTGLVTALSATANLVNQERSPDPYAAPLL